MRYKKNVLTKLIKSITTYRYMSLNKEEDTNHMNSYNTIQTNNISISSNRSRVVKCISYMIIETIVIEIQHRV